MAGLVVSALTGVMNPLLKKLTTMVGMELKLLQGVGSQVSFLKEELSSMSALLVKLASMEEELDAQTKEWMGMVRELTYDMEDCIDQFMLHCGGDDKKKMMISMVRERHKIASLVQQLKARAMEASQRHERYKLAGDHGEAHRHRHLVRGMVGVDPRLPALYVGADRLVGIDGPREEIIELLMAAGDKQAAVARGDHDHRRGRAAERQPPKVVSILGFGGLGKTTLAMQVYSKIKWQFNCAAFVSVSRSPNTKKILTDMLRQVGSNVDLPTDTERQLIEHLRLHLGDKRYLIVIDDIWSVQAWEVVKCALPDNKYSSKIMTTTRIVDVAKSCCPYRHDHVFQIGSLSDEDSQKLFLRRIFGSEHSCPPQLKEISTGILKRCGGMPLAIISIASMLASKSDTKEQWERVRDSLSSALESSPKLEGMRKILLFSYYDLPCHLKTCLLYLSIFPEDYEIKKDHLLWKWIAEGFIMEERGQKLEQVGESYFNELINRSMIQPVGIWHDGRVDACRVHDIVLDLIISLSTKENFITRLGGQELQTFPDKIRRLSIQSDCTDEEVKQITVKNGSHIRSLNTFGCASNTSLVSEFHCLRVLDLGGCECLKIECIIASIPRFHQLRYLRLGGDIVELPEQIGDLQFLQTLDLTQCSVMRKLPPTLVRLSKLVRLFVHRGVRLPDNIGSMQALQELSRVFCQSTEFVEELGQLARLRVLEIECLDLDEMHGGMESSKIKTLVSSLSALGKHSLQSLQIWDINKSPLEYLMVEGFTIPYLQKLVIWDVIPRVHGWMANLVNLTHLEITVGRMEGEADPRILSCIPGLLFLDLKVFSGPWEILSIVDQGFQHLRQFHFHRMGGGIGLVFAPGSMPRLRIFRLYFEAKKTTRFDYNHSGIVNLLSLKYLGVIIDSYGAREEMNTMVTAISNLAATLPNHPKLEICERSGLLITSKFRNRLMPTSSSNIEHGQTRGGELSASTSGGSEDNQPDGVKESEPGSSELSANRGGSGEENQSEVTRKSEQPGSSELSASTSGSSEENQSEVTRKSEQPGSSQLSASTSGSSEDNRSKGESSLFNCSETSLHEHGHPQGRRSPPPCAHSPSSSNSAHTNELVSRSMQALNALSGVSGAQYAKAVDRFGKKKIFMELFLDMPPHRRMDWLLHLD